MMETPGLHTNAELIHFAIKHGLVVDHGAGGAPMKTAEHLREDGLAGISDDKQRPCFALALWNGKDPILDERGRRPVYGGTGTFQTDPHSRDHILFFEYFHGDNGAGLGASHQTGWTGAVATIIELYGLLDARRALETGKQAAFDKGKPAHVAQPVS